MTRRTPASNDEAIEATAAAWLAEREAGFTPEDERAFAAWCAADPRHAAAIERIDGLWGALQQLRDYRPQARVHPDQDLLRPPASGFRRFPLAAGLAAAAGLLLMFTAWLFWPAPRAALPAQTFATTTDGYQRVSLADGSVLELNANTEVKVRLLPQERQLQLVRGEAHFKVAKDPNRPFWVEAGVVAVRAVGTAFDVRLGGGKVEVLVTEGKVRVASAAVRHGRPAPAEAETLARGYDLVANQVTTVPLAAHQAARPTVEDVDAREIGARLAWQEPRLVFVDTPLAETVAQFNRRNRVQIVLADPELGAMPVVGTFRAGNVEAFVRLIATPENGIAVARPDAEHIVLHRAP